MEGGPQRKLLLYHLFTALTFLSWPFFQHQSKYTVTFLWEVGTWSGQAIPVGAHFPPGGGELSRELPLTCASRHSTCGRIQTFLFVSPNVAFNFKPDSELTELICPKLGAKKPAGENGLSLLNFHV